MISAGIRAFVGKLSMDKSSSPSYIEASAQTALSAAASFADKCLALEADRPSEHRLVQPVLTPRFVPTCSDELLVGLGQLSSSKGLRIQSHMAEALDQVKWVRSERGVEDIEVFERVSGPPRCQTPRFTVLSLMRSRAEWPPHLPHDTSPLHFS